MNGGTVPSQETLDYWAARDRRIRNEALEEAASLFDRTSVLTPLVREYVAMTIRELKELS